MMRPVSGKDLRKRQGRAMCGRFGYRLSREKVEERFGLRKIPDGLVLSYNVSPGKNVPTVLNTSPDELSFLRWGLIPHWAKWEKEGFNLVNAKAETILAKPMFKELVRVRRCLILADCYYEWKEIGQRRIPYRILMKDERPFAFAGLWDSWLHNGQEVRTCLIITTRANKLVRTIHDRMPVILPPDKERVWLSVLRMEEVESLLQPYEAGQMHAYEISTEINSPRNDSASIIRPVSAVQSRR